MEIFIPEKEYGPLEHILITEEKSTEGLNTFMLETEISQEHHVIKGRGKDKCPQKTGSKTSCP